MCSDENCLIKLCYPFCCVSYSDPHEVETLSSVDLASRELPPGVETQQKEQALQTEEPEDLLSSRSVAEKARQFNLKEQASNESPTKRTKSIDTCIPTTPTRTIAIQTEKDSNVNAKTKPYVPIVRWNTLEKYQSEGSSVETVGLQRSTSIPDSETVIRRGISPEAARSRFEVSPRGKTARSSFRREKSLQQRREDERQIQKSRVLSNSYELSSDLKNKQVILVFFKFIILLLLYVFWLLWGFSVFFFFLLHF